MTMDTEYSKRKIVYITLGILAGILVITGTVFLFAGKSTLIEKIIPEAIIEQPIEEKVEPLWESTSIELGTEVEQDINNYITGDMEAIEEATLDLSKVNKDVAGTYEAYVNIGERTITYSISVVDTIAPELTLKDEVILAQGREYGADYFIENAYDLSNDITFYVVLEDSIDSTVRYDSRGAYLITIGAKDISGNETTKTMYAVVEVAPYLVGVRDVSVKTSSEYDFLAGIAAVDYYNGDITEQIVVNTDEVDLSTAGEYEVIYTVVDSLGFGLETSQSAIITVCDEEPVNDVAANSLTLEEMELLCDWGYFTYEPLLEENLDEAIKLVEPTLISIYCSCGSGAGYIYKITPEYIYIVTEAHVMTQNEDYKFVFFDKTTIEIPCAHRIALNTNKKYKTNAQEIILYRAKTSSIDKNTLVNLKQAYYKEDQFIYNTQKVFTYTKWYSKCKIENLIKTSTIVDAMERMSQQNPFYVIQTTCACISGQSGSPTYDYEGRLIGMIFAKNATNDFHLYVDELKNFDSRLDEFDQFE